MSNKVNIALATDLGYIKQTMLVIESVMLYASKEKTYVFYILTDADSEKIIKKYQDDLSQRFPNCMINCVVMSDVFNNVYLRFSYITKTTYYRLYIPNVILEEKCIYIDSDTIVCDDIAQLYDIDIEGYEIAGVKNIPSHISSDKQIEHMKRIGILLAEQYINAGVLLLNLFKMRENGFCKNVELLIDKNFPLQDQDIINVISCGKIKLLPLKYNVQGMWIDMIGKYPEIGISSEEKEEAIKNPMIIHYASAEKPWEFLEIPFADKWWKVCKVTNWFESFYQENKESFYYYGVIHNHRLWHLPIFSEEWIKEIRQYSDVYVYGAGVKGKNAIRLLKEKDVLVKKVLVSDVGNNLDMVEGIEVEQISDFLNREAVFVIALSRMYLPQVRRLLFEKGYYNVISLEDI